METKPVNSGPNIQQLAQRFLRYPKDEGDINELMQLLNKVFDAGVDLGENLKPKDTSERDELLRRIEESSRRRYGI